MLVHVIRMLLARREKNKPINHYNMGEQIVHHLKVCNMIKINVCNVH